MTTKKSTSNKVLNVLAGASLLVAGGLAYDKYQNTHVWHDDTLYAPRNTSYESTSPANQQLLKFPDELPGAASVKKLLVPGAEHVLVHIRQIHYRPNLSDGIQEVVFATQDDIFRTLEALVEDGEDEFYKEGLELLSDGSYYNPAQIDVITSRIKLSEFLLENYESQLENYDMPSLTGEKQHTQDELRAKIVDTREELAELNKRAENRNQYDALDRLLQEHPITILPAEYVGLNVAAEQALYNDTLSDDERDELVVERREDFVLNLVSRRDDPFAVVVYGAAHDWSDNIQEWNRINDKKFSLIVVTPETVADVYDVLYNSGK